MVETLLPPSASKDERNVEAAIFRAADLETVNRCVWHPDRAPVELLPWLAWALSVDVWNADWPETVKRQAIKVSAAVHKKKGTPGAVRRALAAMDLGDIEIKEWPSFGGDPYTFRVFLSLSTRGLSEAEAGFIDRTIAATKNTRSHLDQVRIFLTSRAKAPSIAAALVSGETITAYPYSITELEVRAKVPTVAVGFYGVDTMTAYPGAN